MFADNKIREIVQAQEGFLEWILQSWREKNWLRLLLVLEAVCLILLNPKTLNWGLSITERQPPRFYALFWLVGVVLIFILAVVIALRVKSVPKPIAIDERRTIKGLRPFSFNDAEIFNRLQRNEVVRECVSAIADPQFRFGVLSGQSGSGKTSFLQAGLWPALARNKTQCLYVKFTELDPLETLRAALVDRKLISSEASEDCTLAKLLDSCDLSGAGSLVLLFDQFEQFFLQNKRVNDRKPFIAGLANWYQTKSNKAIKILVCIRSDFSDRLIELQKIMGYSLGPQETFRLDRFDPQQAAAVLRVIAQTEGITVDEAFVEELANQQLASSEDGLISPVDIQILAWMVAGENAVADRAFNRAAYEALGGIEGLLEKFLKRALSARETPSRHQSALNVLLALTDFDSDSRAGTLTLDQLGQKLQNTITSADLEEATSWLARSDVRLITPNQQGTVLVYELAHERLIPALRRLAAKELTEVDRARRLLERKVDEWIANGKKSRYLLRGRELKLIKRNRAQIIRIPQKDAKAKFLARSLVRFRMKFSAFCITLLLTIGGVLWWFSPSGQIWQAQRDLASLTYTINDTETLYRVAKNLLRAGRLDEVSTLAANLTPSHRIEILAQLRRRYEDIGAEQEVQEIKKAEEHLQQQLLDADNIPQDDIALGIAYSKLGDMSNASKFINEAKEKFDFPVALWSVYTRSSRPRRSSILLAQAYQEIGDLKRSAEELSLILNAGSSNFDDDPTILIDIASLCEKLGSSHCDSKVWKNILRSGETLSSLNRVSFLNAAARALSAFGQSEKAEALLKEAQIELRTVINSRQSRFSTYEYSMQNELLHAVIWDVSGTRIKRRRLIDRYFKLRDAGLLDSENRARIFRSATQAYSNIATDRGDISFLEEAEDLITGLERKDTAELYLNLASSYLALGHEQRAIQMLHRACIVANYEHNHEESAKLADLIKAAFEKLSEGIRTNISLGEPDLFWGVSEVSNVWLLSLQAQLLWRNGRADEARKTLTKAEELAQETREVNCLVLLANTCALMGETSKASRYLERVTVTAAALSQEAKADAMSAICDSYARNKQWRRARQVADQTGNDVIKAVSLSNLLAVWKDYNPS